MAFAVSQGALRSMELPLTAAPSSVRLSADFSPDYAALYRSQRAVNTAVSAIARQVAQIGLHAFARKGDTDRERNHDSDLARLLRRPAPGCTPYAFKYGIAADLAIFARYVAVKSEHDDGTPALIRLPPLAVEPVGGSWAGPEAFKVGRTTLPAEKVVYIRGYAPDASHSGVSPLESLRQTLSEDYQANQMREQLYRNGARVSGYLERPVGAPTWSDPARNNFRTAWRAQYTGSGAQVGGTPILEDGMTFKPASDSPKDMQYIEARKLTREEVAAAYHIPPTMVGIMEHATFGNIAEQHQMLYQDTLGPWLAEIQEELLLQLHDWLGVGDDLYLEFNIAEKLRGSFEDQAAQLQAAVGGPYMTRGEARARLNLPKIDGADDLIVPLNVVMGDQGGAPKAAGAFVERAGKNVATLHGRMTSTEQHIASRSSTLGKAGASSVRAKAADEDRAEELAATLTRFFRRQAAAVKSKLGAKADVAWWDEKRWDEELAADLLPHTLTITTAAARAVLADLEEDPDAYDVERTREYLKVTAADNAASINAATRIAVEEALEDEDAPLEQVAHVFEVAEESRAAQIAGTVVTAALGFASVEAVEQVRGDREAYKEWVTTSANPRASHAAMNGERVPLDDVFSNGARWPGWGGIDVDETAGCECIMVIGWND